MRFLTILLWLVFFGKCLAHDANQAYFSISIENNKTLILAELPWTIRNAINEFDPKVEDTKSEILIQKSLENYLTKHLILFNEKQQTLKLIEVKLVDSQHRHSHQLNYQITYKGSDFISVKNSILMEINKKQTNTHLFDGTYFTTTNEFPIFIIENNSRHSPLLSFGVVIVLGLLIILLIFKTKKI